jgi:hypothetical protein
VIPPSGAPTIGAASCTPGALNSTGVAGQLTATGSVFVPHNDVTLHATSLPPNSFGFFLVSRVLGAPIVPPGSLGNLCLTSPIGRYVGPGQIQNTGAVGAASLVLDLTLIPQPTGFVSVAPGETWHFQLWNRDAIGGIATSVFTAARSIQF